MSRSISDRTVSTANSGMPCAWLVILDRAASGIPGTRASTSAVHRGRIQRVQGQHAPVPPGAEPRPGPAQLGPGEYQHVDGQIPGPVDQVIQEIQQPGVGVLGVLHQQHHRVLGREPLEEQPPPGEQLLPGQRGPVVAPAATPSSRPSRVPTYPRSAGSVTYRSSPSASLAAATSAGSSSAMPSRCRTISASAQKRHPLAVGQAPAPVPPHLRRQPVGVLLELPAQPRLAHPGRAGHQHQPRHPPVRRRMKQVLDRAQLRVPAGQRRLQPVHPLAPAHRRQHPGRPPQTLRLGLALQRVLPGIGEPDRAARQPLRRPVDQHRARLGRRLHPGRGVHRISRHHPLTDGAQVHRHLAGHHPRPHRQARHPRLGAQLGHGATRSSAARTARSASPSVAVGVPHTAITASPMNFSTTPPYRVITVRATLKYCDSSSRTASGSRASDSGVNPTTSQNSTEHTRRSATGSGLARESPPPGPARPRMAQG